MKDLKQQDQALADELLGEMSETVGAAVDGSVPEGTLEAVLGVGDTIVIGGKVLNLAPFTFLNLPKAGALLKQVPEIVQVYAFVGHSQRVFDPSAAAAKLNELNDRMRQMVGIPDEGSYAVTASDVERAIGAAGSNLSEVEADAMLDLVMLSVSRHEQAITREQLSDNLTIPLFIKALVSIFDVNVSFADRL